LPAAIELVNQFPDQPFVIDHIAKPDIKSGDILSWKKGIQEISKAENISCKISGMVTEADWKNWKTDDLKPYLDIVFENFSADKLMFGSDWPVLNVASNYTEVVKTLEDYIAQLSVENQNKIWFQNAISFYKL
jgi:L-fuconolactonase